MEKDSMINSSTTVYSSDSIWRNPGAFFSGMWCDLLKSEELARRFLIRDIKAQYRQSLLGYFWAFIPPLAMTLTFVLLKSQKVFPIADTNVPYPAYALVGTLLWQNFVDSMRSPIRVVSESRDILSKVSIPPEALIIGGLGSVVFMSMIRLVLLIPLFLFYGLNFGMSMFLFPVGLAAIYILGLGFGVILAPLGVLYRDVGNTMAIAIGFWMLLTPVVYPVHSGGIMGSLARFNPVSPLIVVTRDWLFVQSSSLVFEFWVVTGLAVCCLFTGWFLYRVALPHVVARLGM